MLEAILTLQVSNDHNNNITKHILYLSRTFLPQLLPTDTSDLDTINDVLPWPIINPPIQIPSGP